MTDPAHLKLELAAHGARLDPSVAFARHGARLDGTSLDILLPGGIWVSAPIDERRAAESPFVLVAEGSRHFLVRPAADGATSLRLEVHPTPPPGFLERRTSRGIPMARIATLRGSHLIVSPGSACGFSVRGTPCRFCLEGARGLADRDGVTVGDVVETVRAAFDEGVGESVYFNTGFYDGEDGGIAYLAPYIEAVRKHFDTLVATQVHPPRADRWIDRTYALGVDALSYNLEIFDKDLLNRHCIGRARYIGRDRYLDALGYAASIFPSGTVWSDLVIGLEPAASTRAGIDALAGMGVVPVVSLFGGGAATPPPSEATPLLAHLYRAVRQRGINMGWVRDLGLGVTPLEARHFAGDGARLAVTVQHLSRSRLGSLAARGLARFRRRLRVRKAGESFGAAHP